MPTASIQLKNWVMVVVVRNGISHHIGKWFIIVQWSILGFNEYTVYEYILFISKYKHTDFVSKDHINLCDKMLFTIKLLIFDWCVSE